MFQPITVRKWVVLTVAVVGIAAFAALPAAAQGDGPAYPVNTITVTGSGDAQGAPDAASVEVGVEVFSDSVADAFTRANDAVRGVFDALTGLGIAPEDIRTSNLSVYTDIRYSDGGGEERGFRASNTVSILVRDVAQVEAALDAAIAAGATNIYGLNFIVTDTSALESQARVQALENARARADELARAVGATLGDAIIISEVPGGYAPLPYAGRFDMAEGSGGAFVTPGQSTVTVQVQVTYTLAR